MFSCLDRIEKSLKEQVFSASREGSGDIRRILAVYYEQNVTSEKFEDSVGERRIIPEDQAETVFHPILLGRFVV